MFLVFDPEKVRERLPLRFGSWRNAIMFSGPMLEIYFT